MKDNPCISNYLLQVDSRSHRVALTRLMISAHKLKIETGRYSKVRIEQNERFCEYCKDKTKQIDNEIHFIYDCLNNKSQREMFFMEQNLKQHEIDRLSVEKKTELCKNMLLSNSKEMLSSLAKFIYQSEIKRRV